MSASSSPLLSANLGFLWKDRPLAAAIVAAAQAGFDAVECHWPFNEDIDDVAAALAASKLPMIGQNTPKGGADDFGLCAVPGRAREALAGIDQAVNWAARLGVSNVHAMAGISDHPEAGNVFAGHLKHACAAAAPHGITILIEPINQHDVPGYHLNSFDQAAHLIADLALPNLRLMFDTYHVARMGEDVIARLNEHIGIVGHVQIAGVPDRAEPDKSTIDQRAIAAELQRLGYQGYVGAEYRPSGPVEAGLGWMADWRQS